MENTLLNEKPVIKITHQQAVERVQRVNNDLLGLGYSWDQIESFWNEVFKEVNIKNN